jgi:hypothetical protein
MTLNSHRGQTQQLLAAAAMTLLLTLNPSALAAPGAHGPNGEHLDAPTAGVTASTLPRLEAKSDLFELVATLQAGELSVLIDRFATNEPVLGATLEVESAGVKAKATFHADQGDYAFDDPKLLALLRSPGEHALVFTLVAGADSDLLDGTLLAGSRATVAGPGEHGHGHDDHGHDHEFERAAWIGGGIAALGLLGGIAWWWQRRRPAGAMKGAL